MDAKLGKKGEIKEEVKTWAKRGREKKHMKIPYLLLKSNLKIFKTSEFNLLLGNLLGREITIG